MATIHLFLQGKSGIGQSFAAMLLYQRLWADGHKIFGLDADAANPTLAGYGEFTEVESLALVKDGEVDLKLFDLFMEKGLGLPAGAHLVVDSGALGFLPLCRRLKEHKALELFQDQGHEAILHSVAVGGQASGDSLAGLNYLLESFAGAPLTLWVNRYFGEVEADGGKDGWGDFARFRAIIRLPNQRGDVFDHDLQRLMARGQSFKTALAAKSPPMTRRRLNIFWEKVRLAIEAARLF